MDRDSTDACARERQTARVFNVNSSKYGRFRFI